MFDEIAERLKRTFSRKTRRPPRARVRRDQRGHVDLPKGEPDPELSAEAAYAKERDAAAMALVAKQMDKKLHGERFPQNTQQETEYDIHGWSPGYDLHRW